MKPKPTTRRLGTCQLGDRMVELLCEPKSGGGSFYFGARMADIAVSHDNVPAIVIGLGRGRWWSTVDILLHEAMEFAFAEARLRFEPDRDYGDSRANYLFVMSHEQFGEATARASMFITKAMPLLEKAWEKQHKK